MEPRGFIRRVSGVQRILQGFELGFSGFVCMHFGFSGVLEGFYERLYTELKGLCTDLPKSHQSRVRLEGLLRVPLRDL